jgi:phage/plasmid-associated DNA primase|uniref:Uncharacterized protein n=1 Tax=viral metagenome TaxID=1070528 RepID=A0A6C0IVU3_9ZZZZ
MRWELVDKSSVTDLVSYLRSCRVRTQTKANITDDVHKLFVNIPELDEFYKHISSFPKLFELSECQSDCTALAIECEILQNHAQEMSSKSYKKLLRKIVLALNDMFDVPDTFTVSILKTPLSPMDSKNHQRRIRFIFSDLAISQQQTHGFLNRFSDFSMDLASSDTQTTEVTIPPDSAYKTLPVIGTVWDYYKSCDITTDGDDISIDTDDQPLSKKHLKLASTQFPTTEVNVKSKYLDECLHLKDVSDSDLAEEYSIMSEIEELKKDDRRSLDVEFYLGIIKLLLCQRDDEDDWKKIILAIRSINYNYKPIAKWFSMHSIHKEKLDKMWQATYGAEYGRVSLLQMALYYDLESGYTECCTQTARKHLHHYAERFGGMIEDGIVSDILGYLVGHKYVRDEQYWFEFITGEDCTKPGELYKWRKTEIAKHCTGLFKYVRNSLIHLYIDVQRQFELEYKKIMTDSGADVSATSGIGSLLVQTGKKKTPVEKKYEKLLYNLRSSERKLHCDRYVMSVIHAVSHELSMPGFIETLDVYKYCFGVGNGVLLMRPDKEPLLIDRYNNYRISRFTTVSYVPYDKTNPYVSIIEKELLKNLIKEKDARDAILMSIACCLTESADEVKLVILQGTASNGKSSLMKLVTTVFGNLGATLEAGVLVGKRESSSQANSAFMALKGARIATCKEPDAKAGEAPELHMGRVKEVLGQESVSGRELYGKQETFTPHTMIFLCLNPTLKMESMDPAIWRRIMYYHFKTEFKDEREFDATNPRHMPKNTKFINEYPDDPDYLSAFLSIIVKYHTKFHQKYDGKMENIRGETITKETKEFRDKTDRLSQFIGSYCYTKFADDKKDKKDTTIKIKLEDVAYAYIRWFSRRVDPTRKYTVDHVISQLEMSVLQRYISIIADKNGINRQYLSGIVLIEPEDDEYDEDGSVEISIPDLCVPVQTS